MPEFLTYDRALELLREVIAEKGEDYVYPRVGGTGCYYVRDGAPSCGVGHVFYRAGRPLEVLAGLDKQDTASVGGCPMVQHWAEPEALRLLDAFQCQQDLGVAWGLSLSRALDEFGRPGDHDG